MHLLRLSIVLALITASNSNAAIRNWTGAGTNNSWTTPSNWSPSAPSAGDDLVFPPGNLRKNAASFTRRFFRLGVDTGP